MKSFDPRSRHSGVALVVSLLFLLVVTVIALVAASNSSMGLKMSDNMADASASFESAEAGVIAVLALASDPVNNPFKAAEIREPFANFNPATDHPLRNISDGPAAVDVDVFITNQSTSCPRSASGSSVGLLDCDYYRVESEHEVLKKARTKVSLGVVKTIIGNGNI